MALHEPGVYGIVPVRISAPLIFIHVCFFERRMSNTDRALTGSQTASRTQGAQDLSQMGDNNFIQNTGKVIGAAVDPPAAARAGVQDLTNSLAANRKLKINQDTAEAITNILTGNSPVKIGDIQKYAKGKGISPSVLFNEMSKMQLPSPVRKTLAPVLSPEAQRVYKRIGTGTATSAAMAEENN